MRLLHALLLCVKAEHTAAQAANIPVGCSMRDMRTWFGVVDGACCANGACGARPQTAAAPACHLLCPVP